MLKSLYVYFVKDPFLFNGFSTFKLLRVQMCPYPRTLENVGLPSLEHFMSPVNNP